MRCDNNSPKEGERCTPCRKYSKRCCSIADKEKLAEPFRRKQSLDKCHWCLEKGMRCDNSSPKEGEKCSTCRKLETACRSLTDAERIAYLLEQRKPRLDKCYSCQVRKRTCDNSIPKKGERCSSCKKRRSHCRSLTEAEKLE